MGRIEAICRSTAKGTAKREIPEAKLIAGWGMEDDAHAGKWHRQISLLALEQIEAFRARGAQVEFGAFGENLILSGLAQDLKTLPVGTLFRSGDVLLRLTQVGKQCHSHCAIYAQVGDCIMPREGVFTEVLSGGVLHAGDAIEIVPEEVSHD